MWIHFHTRQSYTAVTSLAQFVRHGNIIQLIGSFCHSSNNKMEGKLTMQKIIYFLSFLPEHSLKFHHGSHNTIINSIMQWVKQDRSNREKASPRGRWTARGTSARAAMMRRRAPHGGRCPAPCRTSSAPAGGGACTTRWPPSWWWTPPSSPSCRARRSPWRGPGTSRRTPTCTAPASSSTPLRGGAQICKRQGPP